MADAALEDDLNNLVMSRAAEPLLAAVKQHIKENVEPIVEEFYRLGENRTNRWSWAPGQLELLQTAKDKAKKSGATAAQLAAQKKEMAEFAEWYKNPLVNIAITFIEPLPVGLVFTLVTAGVLSRKRRDLDKVAATV